jgi:pyruvate formate lyase activating enzyme
MMFNKGVSGLIFDIQRFSIHDGPGIRTSVFFKGCSLRCFWCHNPEGISVKQQIQFTESRCITCGACVVHCQEGAQQLVNGIRNYDRGLCKECGECIQYCYSEALMQVGRTVTVDEVMQEVVADKPFYMTSGGGVTLSGGEPALQVDFAVAVLEACRMAGIHTAIETAGNVPWPMLKRLVELSDLIMMDLKHLDDEKHRTATGVSNQRVLENARNIVLTHKPVVFRTPVIPTVNDNPGDMLAIGEFIFNLITSSQSTFNSPVDISWEWLPFHKLAADKYRSLGMDYKAKELNTISKEKLNELVSTTQVLGVPVKLSI